MYQIKVIYLFFYSLGLSTSDWQCCSRLLFTTAGLRISPYMREKNWSVQMWGSIWSHQWSTSILTPRLEIYTDSLSSDSDKSVTSPPSFFLFGKELLPVEVKNNQNTCGWNGIAMSKKGTDRSSLPPIGPWDFIHLIHFPLSPLILLSDVKSPKNLFFEEKKMCRWHKPHKRHGHWKHLQKSSVCLPSKKRVPICFDTGFNRHKSCRDGMWVKSSDSAVGTWIKKDVALGKIFWTQHLHIVCIFVLSADNVYYL